MAGQIKVDSINADSNLALKIANTTVAFIDSSGLRPTSGNVNLDATATSKFYLPSANTVAIQTAGVTAVTVDSSQNTTLAGTASATKLIPTGSSVTGNGMYLPAANSLGLSTNGTNAVYIDSSQNVGIGTASPSYKLDVSGQVRASSGSTASALIATSTNAGGTALNVQNSGTVNMLIGGYNSIVGSGNATDVMLSAVQGVLAFGNGASSTERMRIDSSGNLLVGTTSNAGDYRLAVSATWPQTPAGIICSRAAGQTAIDFINISTGVGRIDTTSTATSYVTSSDYRLKENIAPMTGALSVVAALKPCTYNWKVDGSDGQGFIAHELQAVVPDCVSGAKDAVDVEGNPVHQGVDTSFLVATLTAAIQELKAIVDAQAVRIAALES